MTRGLCSFSVRVCLLAVAATVLLAGPVAAQTTALRFESQPGDYIGGGGVATYQPADFTFTIEQNYRNGVTVVVSRSNPWFQSRLEFASAANAPLTLGSYEAVGRYPFAIGNALSVSASGTGCGQVTGRFVVREIELSGNTVVKFAADFEQHCEDANPGLFGAIRYNSAITDLEPFEGDYPHYELTIAPAAHGRVTGGGLDCGSAATTCHQVFVAPTEVVLSAVPDVGYAFVGWSGSCSGAIAIWLRVNQRKTCSAIFEPGFHGITALFADSEPGDPLAQGVDSTVTPVDGTFHISRNSQNGVSVYIQPPNNAFRWSIDLSAAGRATLVSEPGVYGGAGTYPWTPMNGLSISRNSSGCGSTGRFVVLEAVYRTDGSVERFAADIESHCNDAAAGIFLALRYNSSVSSLSPFNGEYPRYTLSVVPDAHGRVAGGGIDCGSGQAACAVSLSAATQLTLTATPDSGYVFTGWTGDCRGALTSALHVNGPKECSARFEPFASSASRTVAYIDSQVGSYVGNGLDGVYSPLNSVWTVRSDTPQLVQIDIADSEDDWSFRFAAPEGQALAAGSYDSARRHPFTIFNGLSVTGSGSGCNVLTGRFVILEIVRAADGTIERFAADFEHHCEDQDPAVFGAIRYNATVDEVVPFGGVYPAYTLSVAPPTHGSIGGMPNLNCSSTSNQCALTLASAARVTLTATPSFGYAFIGWSGDCTGDVTTSVNVNGPKVCAAHFEPAVPSSPRTVFRWQSPEQPGFAPASSGVFSLANSRWTPSSTSGGSGVRFNIVGSGPMRDSSWTLEFAPAPGAQLEVGRTYAAPSAFPSGTAPGLWVVQNSSGCGGGEFTVRQIVRNAQNVVLRFAADFVAKCSTTMTISGHLQYNSSIDIPATTLTLDPSSLQFASVHNGASVIQQPAPQVMRAVLSRSDTPWTATTSQPWIQISPVSGTGSTSITVSLNVLGGHPGTGTASGNITVTLADGTGVSKTANVTIKLHHVGTTLPPFGVIDTPVDNSTGVTGAIPMTGWVLDDLEVTGLTICRDAVGGEGAPIDANCGGAAQIFVGNGVFIEGARPDVQTTFPTHPRSNVGGWGFMLLTNTLPNQGNGTYTFYAYARDREGHVVQIGSRTMTCANANATAPFGAIDTPGQGETIGGANYINFGWALTQNPKWIPIDGSTITVYVDGVSVGSPSYNHYRADIATIFPGLANSNGAVGFKAIDTTSLSNGLHTIVWTATDSAGVTSGLGSRFFRVSNGGSSALTAALRSHSAADLSQVPGEASSLVARRGWDSGTAWRNYAVGSSGRSVLRGEEIDRFEIALGNDTSDATYLGYLRVGDRLDPLPVGSRLDSMTGEFSWSPGVGFIGTYDLVFVKVAGTRPVSRREVRIILQPKATGHVGTQVVIDTPTSQQDLAQPFALGGWAVDLDAPADTGIDTLHVWAYPLIGGAPIFLGTASSGARPDVAAIHGEQFRESGFGLTIQGLTPGNYDLAVFAWSNVTGAFAAPKIVRITAR